MRFSGRAEAHRVSPTEVRPEIALDIHYKQAGGISGHFMLLIMVLMYTTAHHKIRHQCFEVFWYTHHLALLTGRATVRVTCREARTMLSLSRAMSKGSISR